MTPVVVASAVGRAHLRSRRVALVAVAPAAGLVPRRSLRVVAAITVAAPSAAVALRVARRRWTARAVPQVAIRCRVAALPVRVAVIAVAAAPALVVVVAAPALVEAVAVVVAVVAVAAAAAAVARS